MDNLFNNIGEKLKEIAKGIFIFSVILSILAGIITFIVSPSIELIIYVIIGAVVGLVATWINACLIYGFGEIIDRLREISENVYSNNKEQKNTEEDN